jgi:hypothetical protein
MRWISQQFVASQQIELSSKITFKFRTSQAVVMGGNMYIKKIE